MAQIVNLGPVPHPVGPFHITDMSFADRTHGWVIGEFAGITPHVIAMERTKDGGKHWLQTPPPVPRAGVVSHVLFADALHGWTYGPDLYVSRDGGLSWDRQFPGGQVVTMSAAGPAVWAVVRSCGNCDGRLAVSRDGGHRWRSVDAPAVRDQSVQIVWAGTADGWVVSFGSRRTGDSPGHLIATADGGRSWRPDDTPCGLDAARVQLSPATATDLWIYCAGEASAGSQLLRGARSTDGGRQWTILRRGHAVGYFAGLAALSPTAALVANSYPQPLVYRLVGAHQGPALIRSEDDFGLADLQLVGSHGWVVNRATVYRTFDSGRHWASVRLKPDGCGCIHHVLAP